MSAITHARRRERLEVRAVRDLDGSPLVRIDVEANPTEFYDLTPHQARDWPRRCDDVPSRGCPVSLDNYLRNLPGRCTSCGSHLARKAALAPAATGAIFTSALRTVADQTGTFHQSAMRRLIRAASPRSRSAPSTGARRLRV